MTLLSNDISGFYKLQANVPNPASRDSALNLGLYLDLILGHNGQPHLRRTGAASVFKHVLRTNEQTALPTTTLQKFADAQPLILAIENAELADLLASRLTSEGQTIWMTSSSLEILTAHKLSSQHMIHKSTDTTCGERHANTLHTQGIRYAALPKQACTKGTIALYKKFSIDIFGYGLVQLREMAQAIEAGANGLISTNENNLVATIQEHHKS